MEKTNSLIIYSRDYPVYFEFCLGDLNSQGEALVSVSVVKTIEEQREEEAEWDPYISCGRHLCKGGRLDEGGILIFASEASFARIVRNWYRAHMRNLPSSNRYNSYY